MSDDTQIPPTDELPPIDLDVRYDAPPAFTTVKLNTRPAGRAAEPEVTLRDWCAKFDFLAGVSFIRLTRVDPKRIINGEGRRINVSGHLEDLIEPIDLEYIRDHWGGGSYELSAFQQRQVGNRSRSQITENKFVEIPGDPVAYMGPNGDPIYLDDGGDVEEPEDGFPRPHYGLGDRPASAAEMLSQRTAGDGAVRAVVEAHRDATTRIQESMDRHTSLAERLYREQKAEQNKGPGVLDFLSFSRDQQAGAAQTHREMQETLVTSLQAQGAGVQTAFQSQISAMQLAAQTRETVLNDRIRSLEEELKFVRRDSDQRLTDERRRYDEGLKQAAELAERRLHDRLASAQNHQALLQQQSMSFQSLFSQQKESEVARLTSELQAAKARVGQLEGERDAVRVEVNNARDPLAVMERAKALTELAGGALGGPAATDDGGILASIARNAPAIHRHLVEPVMSRVDRATDMVAQQAVAAPPISAVPGHVAPSQPAYYGGAQGPPQAQPQTQPQAQPQGPPQGPPQGQQAGLSQVVEFLAEKFTENAGPAEVANMVRTAEVTGVLVPGTLAPFLAAPPGQVVEKVQSMAHQNGHGYLASPGGGEFLAGVLTALKG